VSGEEQEGDRGSEERAGLTRRQFLCRALRDGGAAALAGAAMVSCSHRARREPSVVVLGMDGLDPGLLKRFVAEGHLPHFKRFMERGHFSPLRSTYPSQTPTAWSTFITGKNPGGHGVFDMIVRDPRTYYPAPPLARVTEPRWAIRAGKWRVPILGSQVIAGRGGVPFWRYICDAGIPAALYKLPADFPPKDHGGRVLADLGICDIAGEDMNYRYFADAPPPVLSARCVRLVPMGGGRVSAQLDGPANPWRQEEGERLTCPFTVHVSSDRSAALIEIGGERVLLREGEWSEWVPVEFSRVPAPVRGIVRFYLKQLRPHLGLYASPVNIDPFEPVMRISNPPGFAGRIARETGRYYTQGIPAEISGRMDGVFDDEDYLSQAELVWQERERLLDYACRHFDGGLLFFYFTLTDLNTHLFWRSLDPEHPAYTKGLARRHGDVVLRTYRRMDGVLGRMLDEVPPNTALIIMSDHGFVPLRRYVSVNFWLRTRRLYALKNRFASESLDAADVNWRRTAAYCIGYNALYLNRRGREGQGVLDEAEAEQLCRALQQALPEIVDPATGLRPISRVLRTRDLYSGPYTAGAPDLMVCFRPGYRASWFDAMGGVAPGLTTENDGAWSGDHLIDPQFVPGVLLTNRPIQADSPGLEDIGPSVCALFGVPAGDMEGRNVLAVD